jgi:molybdopterin-guanine dinucleotide biosynthesis protein A
MGSPKALLPLGSTTLIDAVIACLVPLFRRVLVVTRDDNGITGLDAEVLMDQRPERGPLVGLARGLAASDAPWCFVVGCDMPFLRPQVIHRMAEHLDDCDILVPRVGGRLQPLHAFYSQRCLPYSEQLLERGVTSLRALFPLCDVRPVESTDFLDLDPELLSFRDLDTVEEYQAAAQLAQAIDMQGATP